MKQSELNSELNRLLVNIGRSLLQYTGEISPWTDTDEDRKLLEKAIALQKGDVDRYVQFLSDRRWPIDFGVYPNAYTNFHFVALDFLLSRIIENQSGIIEEIETLQKSCADDIAASELLQQSLSVEREVFSTLQQLAKPRAAA